LTTIRVDHNTYSYQATSISDQLFFSYHVDTQTHVHTDAHEHH